MTLQVDDQKRITLPDAEPHALYSYEAGGDGTVTLKPVERVSVERFPIGSLRAFVTVESDAEMLGLLKGCTIEPME